jgi:hypothetical protein
MLVGLDWLAAGILVGFFSTKEECAQRMDEIGMT